MLRDNCALVVGASSGIGAAVAERLAREGFRVALVARREEELRKVADRINQRAGEDRALVFAHDVTCFDEVPALFERIVEALGGLSVVVYAAGVMPPVALDEYHFAKDRQMIEVNLLGMIAWLNEAADLFRRVQAGVIVGVGSVAGDRGRAGQPGYNTSKGAQAIFLESLRNRLAPANVRVITIKPGPVDTPMVRHLGRLPMMITADEAARQIVRAIGRSWGTVYVPRRWGLIMWVIIHIPSFIFRRLGMK
ncbi:MAG: SDR family NAD(P)-dependent oxidoreductase [Candidatus Sumerlaeaceae bacterium]|nr:SDR family NAD(P)-dependent oxidoreductase [Candidatus Sumerlaeaceae bacterium]